MEGFLHTAAQMEVKDRTASSQRNHHVQLRPRVVRTVEYHPIVVRTEAKDQPVQYQHNHPDQLHPVARMEEFRHTVVLMEVKDQTVLFQRNHLDQPLQVVVPTEEFRRTAVLTEGRDQTASFRRNLLDPQLLHAHTVESHRTAVPTEEQDQTALFQPNHLGLPHPAVVQTEECLHTAARMVDKDQIALFQVLNQLDLPLVQRDQHLGTNISHHAPMEDTVLTVSVLQNLHLHQLPVHPQLLSQDAHTVECRHIVAPTVDKVLIASFLADLRHLR